MITYKTGDLFSSDCKVLVNTVNCDGFMGRGIALHFKKLYPDMFKKYKSFCQRDMIKIGVLYLWTSEDKWVLNFPTKDHWRYKSKYSYIEEGLLKFVDTYKEKGIDSIAFPKLGCSNGGLEWSRVKEMIETHLGELEDIDIEVYV